MIVRLLPDATEMLECREGRPVCGTKRPVDRGRGVALGDAMSDSPAEAAAQGAPEPSWGGCVLPVIVAGIFLALGTCTVLTGVAQRRAIAGFTEDRAATFEPVALAPEAVARARDLLRQIGEAAASEEAGEVAVTADDVNAWIATEPLLESLRDTARVRRVGPEGVTVDMSQELRGSRFLNGRFRFMPVPSETNVWQLRLESIEVPGKEVPQGFVRLYRDLHLFRFDQDQVDLQAALRRIGEMRSEEGRVVLVFRVREPDRIGGFSSP